MRKCRLIMIIALIVTLFTAGCASSKSGGEKTEDHVYIEPVFELSEYPVLDGSSTALPLAEALCAALTGADKGEVCSTVMLNGGNKALDALFDSKAEIIIVDKKEGEINAKAEAKSVEVEIIPVARECYVFYTLDGSSEDSETLNITKEEADAVVMGQSDKDIKYDNWYYLSGYLPENVNIVSVEGVMPSIETITSEEYPCSFYYNAVIKADTPADSSARKIIEVLLSDNGQQFIEEAGYVKL